MPKHPVITITVQPPTAPQAYIEVGTHCTINMTMSSFAARVRENAPQPDSVARDLLAHFKKIAATNGWKLEKHRDDAITITLAPTKVFATQFSAFCQAAGVGAME
jgi:hypothetical protein